MKTLLLLFLMFFIATFAIAKVDKDTTKYNYIEIAECFIPVSKEFELIRQESRFEYSFYRPFESMLSGMQIIKNETNPYQQHLNRIKKIPNMILVSEERRGDFSIIVSKFKNSLLKDKIYYLVAPKTTIMFSEFNKEKVYYLIDYCESTWKKGVAHQQKYNYVLFGKYKIPIPKDLKKISNNHFQASNKKHFGILDIKITFNTISADATKRRIHTLLKDNKIFDLVSEAQNRDFKVIVYKFNKIQSNALTSLTYFLINDQLSIAITTMFSQYASEQNDNIKDEISYIIEYLSKEMKTL